MTGAVRRLEYVGGGSEKFWEGSADGALVTVSWGRLGTAGQRKVKDLATAAAAAAHLAKLVAEKEKKGYLAVGAAPSAAPRAAPGPAADTVDPGHSGPRTAADPQNAPQVDSEPGAGATVGAPGDSGAAAGTGPAEPAGFDPSTEDVLVLSPALARQVLPRRGAGRAPRKLQPDALDLVRGLLAVQRGKIDSMAGKGSGVALALRAHRAGEPNPLGAAAEYAALLSLTSWYDRDKLTAIADAWIAEHGVAFAAEAMTRFATVVADGAGVDEAGPLAALGWGWPGEKAAERVRQALATAPEAEYLAAVEAVEGARTHFASRVVAAFLMPSEATWVREVCAECATAGSSQSDERLLVAAVNTADELAEVRERVSGWAQERSPRLLPTVVDALGAAVLPAVLGWLDGASDAVSRKLCGVLGELPTDEAFDALIGLVDTKGVPPVLQEAMRRFPGRAVRLLAGAVVREPGAALLAQLLRAHLLGWPRVVAAVLPGLPDKAAEVVERIRGEVAHRVPEATADALPRPLVDPPWERPRTAAKPVVVTGLTPLGGRTAVWAPGEREEWAAGRLLYNPYNDKTDWKSAVGQFEAGTARHGSGPALVLTAPAELVRPLLADWQPAEVWNVDGWGKRVAERFGVDALDPLLCVARDHPQAGGWLLAPFRAPEVSALMADWLVRLKSARADAVAYFARHGVAAVRPLVPAAIGEPGPARVAAETALRLSPVGRAWRWWSGWRAGTARRPGAPWRRCSRSSRSTCCPPRCRWSASGPTRDCSPRCCCATGRRRCRRPPCGTWSPRWRCARRACRTRASSRSARSATRRRWPGSAGRCSGTGRRRGCWRRTAGRSPRSGSSATTTWSAAWPR